VLSGALCETQVDLAGDGAEAAATARIKSGSRRAIDSVFWFRAIFATARSTRCAQVFLPKLSALATELQHSLNKNRHCEERKRRRFTFRASIVSLNYWEACDDRKA